MVQGGMVSGPYPKNDVISFSRKGIKFRFLEKHKFCALVLGLELLGLGLRLGLK